MEYLKLDKILSGFAAGKILWLLFGVILTVILSTKFLNFLLRIYRDPSYLLNPEKKYLLRKGAADAVPFSLSVVNAASMELKSICCF